MDNLAFLVISGLAGLLSLGLFIAINYRNLGQWRASRLTQIEKAERDLLSDMKDVPISELVQTQAGIELLSLLQSTNLSQAFDRTAEVKFAFHGNSTEEHERFYSHLYKNLFDLLIETMVNMSEKERLQILADLKRTEALKGFSEGQIWELSIARSQSINLAIEEKLHKLVEGRANQLEGRIYLPLLWGISDKGKEIPKSAQHALPPDAAARRR